MGGAAELGSGVCARRPASSSVKPNSGRLGTSGGGDNDLPHCSLFVHINDLADLYGGDRVTVQDCVE